MQLKVSGVPAGQYTVTFAGVEEKAADDEKGYGPALIWRFVVVGGRFDGQVVTRFTGASPTAKNACGKFLKAITGKAVSAGDTIEIDDYLDRRFHAIVADAPSGNGTRVETCVAIAEGAA